MNKNYVMIVGILLMPMFIICAESTKETFNSELNNIKENLSILSLWVAKSKKNMNKNGDQNSIENNFNTTLVEMTYTTLVEMTYALNENIEKLQNSHKILSNLVKEESKNLTSGNLYE